MAFTPEISYHGLWESVRICSSASQFLADPYHEVFYVLWLLVPPTVKRSAELLNNPSPSSKAVPPLPELTLAPA